MFSVKYIYVYIYIRLQFRLLHLLPAILLHETLFEHFFRFVNFKCYLQQQLKLNTYFFTDKNVDIFEFN